jgi:hypothetical protein
LKHLSSLAGIEGLTNLEEIEMDTCRKVTSVDEVAHPHRVEKTASE